MGKVISEPRDLRWVVEELRKFLNPLGCGAKAVYVLKPEI